MKELYEFLFVPSVLWLLHAPLLLFLRWGEYKGNKWGDFDYKQLMVDMILLFVVFVILGLSYIGEDPSTLDEVDPQDDGRWIH